MCLFCRPICGLSSSATSRQQSTCCCRACAPLLSACGPLLPPATGKVSSTAHTASLLNSEPLATTTVPCNIELQTPRTCQLGLTLSLVDLKILMPFPCPLALLTCLLCTWCTCGAPRRIEKDRACATFMDVVVCYKETHSMNVVVLCGCCGCSPPYGEYVPKAPYGELYHIERLSKITQRLARMICDCFTIFFLQRA